MTTDTSDGISGGTSDRAAEALAATDPLAAELGTIRDRVSASGAGPWWTDPNDGDIDEVTIWDAEGAPVAVARTASAPGDSIAAFIAAARSDLPRLLAAVEAAHVLAADWESRAAETYQAAIRAADRGALPERVEALEARSKALSGTAAELRAAIERALTGEDGSQ